MKYRIVSSDGTILDKKNLILDEKTDKLIIKINDISRCDSSNIRQISKTINDFLQGNSKSLVIPNYIDLYVLKIEE